MMIHEARDPDFLDGPLYRVILLARLLVTTYLFIN